MDDVLNEKNFQEIVLDRLYPLEEWVTNKPVPGSGSRCRPDFRCERLKLIVEFNGFRHYTQAAVIFRDNKKYELYTGMGYKVIEFPYWLQPDAEVIHHLFGIRHKSLTTAHQGFMSNLPSDVLPCDFCSLGVQRFLSEFERLPKKTQFRVIWSLLVRKQEDVPLPLIVNEDILQTFRQKYIGQDSTYGIVGPSIE